MKRFCEFSLHDYMDLKPREEILMFAGNSSEDIVKICKEYAEHMNTIYSGGTTTFVKVLSKEEAKLWVNEIAQRELLSDDSEELITSIKNKFKECYGEENTINIKEYTPKESYTLNNGIQHIIIDSLIEYINQGNSLDTVHFVYSDDEYLCTCSTYKPFFPEIEDEMMSEYGNIYYIDDKLHTACFKHDNNYYLISY
jgi:hypothetical protein